MNQHRRLPLRQLLIGLPLLSLAIFILLPGCSVNLSRDTQASGQILHTQWQANPKQAPQPVQLHYQQGGNPEGTPVIWVHGTPGGWSNFHDYLTHPTLTDKLRILLVDRPGWGASQSPELASIDEQAKVLGELVEQIYTPEQPVYLVGHSLGGSIVLRMAMNQPDKIAGLLLIASPADPNLSRPRWYHKFTASWLGRRLLGDGWQQSNREMLALDKGLERLDNWQALDQKLVVLQGDKDFLVKKGNADYLEQQATQARIEVHRFADKGHFIPFEEPDLVVSALLNLVESGEQSASGRSTTTRPEVSDLVQFRGATEEKSAEVGQPNRSN